MEGIEANRDDFSPIIAMNSSLRKSSRHLLKLLSRGKCYEVERKSLRKKIVDDNLHIVDKRRKMSTNVKNL